MVRIPNKTIGAVLQHDADPNNPNPHQEEGVTSMVPTTATPDLQLSLPRVDRPCPRWCELPAGHGWESAYINEPRVSRFHAKKVSRSVSVTAEETAPQQPCRCHGVAYPEATLEDYNAGRICECDLVASGPSTMSEPVISAEIPDEMDTETATQFSVWLRTASILAKGFRVEAEEVGR